MKKTLVSLCLSSLLVACSGGSGGGANAPVTPNKPLSVQKQHQDERNNQANNTNPSNSNLQAGIVNPQANTNPQNANPQGETGNQQANTNPQNSNPQVEAGNQQTNTNLQNGNPQGETGNQQADTNPKNGNLQEGAINQQAKYYGLESINFGHTTSAKVDDKTAAISIPSFTEAPKGTYNKTNGTEVAFTRDPSLKTVTLEEIKVQGEDKHFYTFKLANADDDIYYGYYKDSYQNQLTSDDLGFFNYVVVYDQNRVSKTDVTGLTASYIKKEGFVYGDHDKKFGKFGDVTLHFEKGLASGSISGDGQPNLFKFSGDTSNLIITAEDAGVVVSSINKDSAIATPVFIDSEPHKGDMKYVTGKFKADTWAGVLVGEKQQ